MAIICFNKNLGLLNEFNTRIKGITSETEQRAIAISLLEEKFIRLGTEISIEKRRQEELDSNNANIRVKIETYRTVDINDNPTEVEIVTNKDGSRILKARAVNQDGSVEAMAYVTERINNKAQLDLNNEKLIEGYIGNEGNTLKRVSEDLNSIDARTNKINAKYDAELKNGTSNSKSSFSNSYNSLKIEFNNKQKETTNNFKAPPLDVNNVVRGTMRDENLMWRNGEKSFTNNTNLDEKAVKENYKKKREALLAITPEEILKKIDDYFLDFTISRGIANVINPSAKTNVLDTGIITEDDLFAPIVSVPTFGNTIFGEGNTAINMPLGKPIFNYKGNLFFLNNRNFTSKEANNIADVLMKGIEQLRETGDLSEQLKNYLTGVLYFKTPKKGEKTTRNQVYINQEEGKLYVGDKGESFDLFNINKTELATVLEAAYNYVDVKHLPTKKNPKVFTFNELEIKNGEVVVTKTWPSYQHFLLQKRAGEIAPLTTNIIEPQNEDELPIKQKYPIVNIAGLKGVGVVSNTKETVVKKTEKATSKKAENKLGSINSLFGGTKNEKTETPPPATPSAAATKIGGINSLFGSVKNKTVEKEQENIDKPEIKEDPFGEDVDSVPDNAATRLNIKEFTIQGDKTKEEADVKKMLPQVQFEALKNVANITGGGKAWGYALPHFIAVWEEAPYGVAYHEAFEQVFNFILNENERKDLYNEFKGRKGTFTTFLNETRNYSEATLQEAKEEIADEFAEYKTTGKSISPKVKNLFERLLSFLKELFTGKPLSVEMAFYQLSEGEYANSIIKTPIDIKPQYSRTVQNTPESLVQDTIVGMTSKLFVEKWNKDSALIQQLEENEEEATQVLFKQLYNGLIEYFEGTTNKSLRSILKEQAKLNPEKREELAKLYYDVKNNWENVKDQWGNYMADLKHFLKTFDVGFITDEEGNIQVDLKEERSQGDYFSDAKLFINAKNSASKAIKLLFATVTDSKFVEDETQNAVKRILSYRGNYQTVTDNQMLMPNLAKYAKLFNYTLNNAANINGIEKIIDHLRNIGKNKKIKVNANLQVLLNRLGYDKVAPVTTEYENADDYSVIGWKDMDKANRKMLLKMENVLSKQKPLFFVQNSLNKKEHKILATNIGDRTQQLREEYTTAIKGNDFVLASGKFIKFKKGIIYNLDKNGNVIKEHDDFQLLANLGIGFTEKEFEELPKNQQTEFKIATAGLRADVKNHISKTFPANANVYDLPFAGRLATLAKIYVDNIEGNTAESQHTNPNGKFTGNKILNNFVSYILNDANNAKTLEEFTQLNPQYKDLYLQNSYWLSKFFDAETGKRTSFRIDTGIAEGRTSTGEGISTANLTLGERIIYEINNNLNDIYYTLIPADSTTQWALKVESVIARSFFANQEQAKKEYTQLMWDTLKNEIALAQDYENRKSLNALRVKENGREVGKSLRFFKGILSEKTVNRINKTIDEGGEISEESYPIFEKELLEFIEKRAETTKNSLTEYQLLKKKNGKFTIAGMDTTFFKEQKLTEEKLNDLLFYREANYLFQNIEMHKFLFNDPAQYPDAEKRIKSFLSGREYSNQSEILNTIHDEELNKSGDYIIKSNEFGYKTHSNNLVIKTLRTVRVTNTNKDVTDVSKAYENNDVADAQSWMEPQAFMEMLFKAGARATVEEERLHEWLMAYQRKAMLAKGQFRKENEYSKEFQAADNKLLEQPIPDETLDIRKPIISGVAMENGVAKQYLIKTSTAPLYYYFVEGKPAEEMLLNMQYDGVDMLAMDSAHKVGKEDDKISDFYDKEGKINSYENAFTANYKYYGIQVETVGEKNKQTMGSQLTKLIFQNLYNFGMPIDFKIDGRSGTKEEWETGKHTTAISKALDNYTEILSTMIVERSDKLFKEMGITENEFGYTFEDKKKVADFILAELTRRELPTNLGVGIQINADGEFTLPLEANVNYKKIKEILWSTLENNITKPKISGGEKILLSALGFSDIKKETINGKEVYTDNKLKFYTKEDGVTKACQIAIPFLFGTKILAQIEKSQGFKFENQKEGFKHVLDYLKDTAEGRKLLEGIGFRIPTQGLNSIDVFEIAEFLPPQRGNVIIFPSEITTKAGSDFDVDKMNTYTKNFYIDANGYPKIVPYFDNDEKRIDFFTEEFSQKIDKQIENVNKSIKGNFNLQNTLADLNLENNEKQKNKWIPIFKEMFGENATAVDIEDELMQRLETAGKKLNELKDFDIVDALLAKFLENKKIQGLENAYYDSIKELATLPENFERLITPNSAKQLQAIAGDIQELKQKNNSYTLSNATRLIDSNYMVNKRHLFLIMKKGVGIAAVGNTYLALNQVSDFAMSIPDNLIYNKNINERPNFKVRFKFNNQKDGLLHLSGIQNNLGDWLSDLHSQVIDGAVDVAKDEWLANLLGDARALGPMLYMYKLGISPRTAAYYINQPAIQEYMKRRGIHANISKISNEVKEKYPSEIEGDVQKLLIDAKMSSTKRKEMYASKPEIYKEDEMKNMVGVSLEEIKKNKEQATLQMQMLNDFLGWEILSRDLFTYVNGSNYDTTAFTSSEVVDNKRLSYQKAQITDSISGNTKKLFNSTFVGTTKKAVENLSDAYSTLLNTHKGEAGHYLNKMLLKLYNQFFSMDDKNTYLERAEQSLIDYVSQNKAQYGGFNLRQLQNKLFFQDGNIADLVEAMQKHPLLKTNKVIENIIAIRDQRPGYPSYIQLKEQDYDTFTSNVWTASLKELINGNIMLDFKGQERSSKNLVDYIMISQILQYGIKRSKGSFLHLIPAEKYAELVGTALTNIEGASDWWDQDMFYKNNWQDGKLVPEAIVESVYSIEADDYVRREINLNIKGINVDAITQPISRKSIPFVKITKIDPEDRTNKEVVIYKRVDTGENSPISVNGYSAMAEKAKQRVVYVKVNKLGNKNLQEYAATSQLPENQPIVAEINNNDIIAQMLLNKTTFKVQNLNNLVSSNEFDNSENGEDENYTEKDMNKGNFDQFKNTLKRKGC